MATDPAIRAALDVEPFPSVEAAWFWTMLHLLMRRDGNRCIGETPLRPCKPDDIVRCVDLLFRKRRIDLAHARVLRIWGERRRAPDPSKPLEAHDARLWREAIQEMESPLIADGVVVMKPGPAAVEEAARDE
jgi:hypothetical protein